MKKSLTAVLAISILSSFAAGAQVTGAFTLSAEPSLTIPFGPTLSDSNSTPLYNLGYGVSVRGEYAMPFLRALSAGLVLDADFAPVRASAATASFLGASGELAFKVFPVQRLGLRLGARGGVYTGAKGEEKFTQSYAAGSFDVHYLLSPAMSLGLGASYKAYFPLGQIYSGLGVNLGLQIHLGAGKAGLQVVPRIQPIFPLFYSYYDKNPVGSISVKNAGAGEIQDVSVQFFVRQFMEQPKPCWSAPSLAAGDEKSVPAYALFKDTIFGVTEGTKVAGEIIVAYSYLGREVRQSVPMTVVINNRNGMTWDDTRKAAAFVTSMDPAVRGFALPIAAMARTRGNQAISTNFRIAMAVFDALKVHQVGYVSDPVAPFETRTSNKEVVDYLQFPVQTLSYKGGDCDDLSILVAALLESAGIGTAFITTPGHIYIAFDLGLSENEAKGYFKDPASFIDRDGQAWLPLEITRVQDGFVRAVQSGGQEWAVAAAAGKAGFVPIRDAWRDYAPANTGTLVQSVPANPAPDVVAAAFDVEMQRFFITECQQRIDALKADIAKGRDVPKLRNRLGVLYARYGLLAEAKREFEAVVAAKGLPDSVASAAFINLGNIAYLGSKFAEAFAYYGRALVLQPENGAAVLGYARAGYELGKTKEVDSSMQSLNRIDPIQAAKYSYMSSDGSSLGRAASAEKEITAWSDEE